MKELLGFVEEPRWRCEEEDEEEEEEASPSAALHI